MRAKWRKKRVRRLKRKRRKMRARRYVNLRSFLPDRIGLILIRASPAIASKHKIYSISAPFYQTTNGASRQSTFRTNICALSALDGPTILTIPRVNAVLYYKALGKNHRKRLELWRIGKTTKLGWI